MLNTSALLPTDRYADKANERQYASSLDCHCLFTVLSSLHLHRRIIAQFPRPLRLYCDYFFTFVEDEVEPKKTVRSRNFKFVVVVKLLQFLLASVRGRSVSLSILILPVPLW